MPGGKRWSCQTTKTLPVAGSMAAPGRPSPVRELGTGATVMSATVTGELQVSPPSLEEELSIVPDKRVPP